jgi:hypothetical protein
MPLNTDIFRGGFSSFPVDERWVLDRFLRKVNELNGSAFAGSETSLGMESIRGATYLGGPAWQVKTEGPSEETVMAVMLAFRQLYVETNRTSAARVINILSRSGQRSANAAGGEVIAFCRTLKRDMKRRLTHDPRGVFLEESGPGEAIERTPEEIVAIWLNGEYFHDDRELADQLDPPGHMSYEVMQVSLQMTIRDFIRYWDALGQLVKLALSEPTATK